MEAECEIQEIEFLAKIRSRGLKSNSFIYVALNINIFVTQLSNLS